MASDLNDEEFRNELVELFTLEAEEWLQQAHTAILDLQGQGHAPANPKLLDIIQQGMSNLGGSAATVELPEVQQLAFDVLPLLDTMRGATGASTPEDVNAIQESLERLTNAVRELSSMGGVEDEASDEVEESADVRTPSTSEDISVEALRQVQQDLAHAGRASRNLIDLVIEHSRGSTNGAGDVLSKSTVTKALRELEGMDEQFLNEAQQRMPKITQAVAKLKALPDPEADVSNTLAPVIRSVQALRETAGHARATSIIQFLEGLSNFLDIVAGRGVPLVLGRLDAVEFRLGAVIPMVHQWVELGRIEREAIGASLWE